MFGYYEQSPGKNITRDEYLELAQLLRPGISHSLGVRNATDAVIRVVIDPVFSGFAEFACYDDTAFRTFYWGGAVGNSN